MTTYPTYIYDKSHNSVDTHLGSLTCKQCIKLIDHYFVSEILRFLMIWVNV